MRITGRPATWRSLLVVVSCSGPLAVDAPGAPPGHKGIVVWLWLGGQAESADIWASAEEREGTSASNTSNDFSIPDLSRKSVPYSFSDRLEQQSSSLNEIFIASVPKFTASLAADRLQPNATKSGTIRTLNRYSLVAHADENEDTMARRRRVSPRPPSCLRGVFGRGTRECESPLPRLL